MLETCPLESNLVNMDYAKDKPRTAESLMLYVGWSGDLCHERLAEGLFLSHFFGSSEW